MEPKLRCTKFIQICPEREVTISLDRTDLSVDDMIELFKSYLLAVGFHPDNVKCIQYVEGEEFSDEEE